jgi:hypothetical protein
MSTHTVEALGARLAAARDMLGDALQDSRTALVGRGSHGLFRQRQRGVRINGGQPGGEGRVAVQAEIAQP